MSRFIPPRESSIDLDSPDRPFDNIINFRDVGRTINRLMGRPVLKEGVFYRSARLDEASERDKRRLVSEYHISTIIDLRSGTEHDMATAKRSACTPIPPPKAPAETESETGTEEPKYIHLPSLPGVSRHLISLTGRALERALVWRLDWWNFIKVLSYLASGNRIDAITLIGREVMNPRGLVGLAKDTLDNSTAEMREVFEILGGGTAASLSTRGNENENETRTIPAPVLVHCTQGKDRTGLVVLLLLLLTGVVDDEAMAAEYVLSESELAVEGEERMKEIRALGLDDEFARCPGVFTREVGAYLDERYGGVQGYLGGVLGVDVERLRGHFVVV
ncbi:hypothetical protein P175DRAFT_0441647 [Aspergillus ochraceoroseus IBT 24754]|uniref:Tyrosine specific protein phosphatases domain-containing protein n=1 Tax=Aspergillus ochraceoroseus IBT 24754 TaxID=1392256 RepID=A0A2T5LSJ1_9EURO|nr:uncharacterized protein P175DRAFT_0441647 [Aspergillus ochraceoroseus IBT 24754]PTU19241.1 hypothetical protein P175DRAFT_0441647 [Aspergillus ochraceoroseus IBT 24754]